MKNGICTDGAADLCGVNGILAQLSKTLILTYVNPVALYGLEALCLEGSDITALDKYQCRLLLQIDIQSLLKSTAIPAI